VRGAARESEGEEERRRGAERGREAARAHTKQSRKGLSIARVGTGRQNQDKTSADGE
jgi:hypothetical protein